MNQINQIIRYEQGELEQNEMIELFSELVKSGLAWQLQGHYGRTAKALIKQGFLSVKGEIKQTRPASLAKAQTKQTKQTERKP